MSQPKLGSGERFRRLKEMLAKKGASNPAALASFIGRKKFGAKKFNHFAKVGRERHEK